jgi:hypothetical protein
MSAAVRSSSSSSSAPQLRHASSQPSLAQQQQQQMQDIKPALMGQIFPYRTKYTYKDKFHALRERYEQVSAVRRHLILSNPSLNPAQTNEALQKELAAAHIKMQKLEAENKYVRTSTAFSPRLERSFVQSIDRRDRYHSAVRA